MADFSSVLKLLRNESSLSQQDLADKLEVSKSSISMYERGERNPDFETLESIADLFNVDIDYLLGRTNKTTRVIQPTAIAAHFDGDEYTEDELEEIYQFAEFVKNKRK